MTSWRPHCVALALSLIAHMMLTMSVGSDGGSDGTDAVREQLLTVRLDAEPGNIATATRQESAAETSPIPGTKQSSSRATKDEPLSLFPFAEPHYFAAKQLTERPRVMHDIPSNLTFVLPDVAPQSTIARLLINERGDVDRVVMEDSALPEDAARMIADAFAKTRFYPGRIGDKPVKSQLRIEVTLENADPS